MGCPGYFAVSQMRMRLPLLHDTVYYSLALLNYIVAMVRLLTDGPGLGRLGQEFRL